ncbi:hypothetical protein BD311DRAFT_740927 [Dichomitus squalens]|uniref:Uncharacterized protein n=1 Tax=Dichomitus squalens TaxID=114155 RepID=A0A4Q9MGY2_9APHY|nr:hypothetical protein BD311DRAFT_740927 [Dichomitus squalens]
MFSKSFASFVVLSICMLLVGASPANIARADTKMFLVSFDHGCTHHRCPQMTSTTTDSDSGIGPAETSTTGSESATGTVSVKTSATASTPAAHTTAATIPVTVTSPDPITATAALQTVEGTDPKVTAYITSVLDIPVVEVSSISGPDIITLATAGGSTNVFAGHTLVADITNCKQGSGAASLAVSKDLLSGAVAVVGAVAVGAVATL